MASTKRVLTKLPKTLRVDVTADDIRLGQCGNAEKCAIARAVMRALKPILKGEIRVEVDGNIHLLRPNGDERALYLGTIKAMTFVEKFDGRTLRGKKKDVKPTVFIFKLSKDGDSSL